MHERKDWKGKIKMTIREWAIWSLISVVAVFTCMIIGYTLRLLYRYRKFMKEDEKTTLQSFRPEWLGTVFC